ncbi:TPA: hypothetical protein HA265_01310 [Candidatus Woesearchaeota archaeon]|nr:hypothetical protein [Candidatus Woesearchaeota archaeon]
MSYEASFKTPDNAQAVYQRMKGYYKKRDPALATQIKLNGKTITGPDETLEALLWNADDVGARFKQKTI